MNVPNEFAEFFQGIDLTKREIAFLIWLSEWDQNTIRNMRTVLEKIQAAGVADGASSQPSNEPPPCYQPDGDGCAYQCYDGQDEPIDKCKECPLCCSDKHMNYVKTIWLWAEPGYRWTLETVGELVILAGRGCRWLGRLLLALLLFLPWLVVGLVLWARHRRRERGD